MKYARRVKLFLAAIIGSVLVVTMVGGPASAGVPDRIVNYGSGLCIQPDDVYDGSRVFQEACTGALEQNWETLYLFDASDPVTPSGGWFGSVAPPDPVYYVVNSLTGKCLDVTDANPNNGATIQQYNCNGG